MPNRDIHTVELVDPESQAPIKEVYVESCDMAVMCEDGETQYEKNQRTAYIKDSIICDADDNELFDMRLGTYVDKAERILTAVVPLAGWQSTSGGAPYTQTISVPGMTADDIPVATVLLTGDDYDLAAEQKEAWSMVSTIETAADSIIVTCLEFKPTVTFTVQLKGA